NIANLTTEASLPSERFVFEFIMVVLFYALCFTMRFRLHIAKSSWPARGRLSKKLSQAKIILLNSLSLP
ncbi:hypothetical protein L3K75_04170, partial [[Ruminococcus] lactaris]|nr:hypothetical protein [[Ruminococcus] lactaris]